MKTFLKTPAGRVRPACDTDIDVIEAWLPKDGSFDSLAVNWDLTKRVYKEDGMLVWEDASTCEPVAYFWGSLNTTSSILEVKPDQRGKGIGRAFVDYLIEDSRQRGEPLLKIHCAPPSSEQFWRSVGFEITKENWELIGRRILKMPQHLPDGPKMQVKVSFFPEEIIRARDREIAPFVEHFLTGVQTVDGEIRLSEKVACFDLSGGKDLAVRIEVEGKEVYLSKAKYSEGEDLGITHCMNGFAIGTLYPAV